MGIGIAFVIGGLALTFFAIPPVSPIALLALILGVILFIAGIRWIAASRRPS